jgi:hypothetical protein
MIEIFVNVNFFERFPFPDNVGGKMQYALNQNVLPILRAIFETVISEIILGIHHICFAGRFYHR